MTREQALRLIEEAKRDERLEASVMPPPGDQPDEDGYRAEVVLRGVLKTTLADLRQWGNFKNYWRGY
ncbi:MAG: hypothetical protein J2P37_00200 [Ktedonobacteraceae bacterium]|nr:hypothetical protein [Ktedonobacteraceae bacterium]